MLALLLLGDTLGQLSVYFQPYRHMCSQLYSVQCAVCMQDTGQCVSMCVSVSVYVCEYAYINVRCVSKCMFVCVCESMYEQVCVCMSKCAYV